MLWEVEVFPAENQPDSEAARVQTECASLGARSIRTVRAARSFLIEGRLGQQDVERAAVTLLTDPIVETHCVLALGQPAPGEHLDGKISEQTGDSSDRLLNVLYKPGITDNVAQSTNSALTDLGLDVSAVATCRKYWINADASESDLLLIAAKILANEAIEQVVWGPMVMESLAVGEPYRFERISVALRNMNDEQLQSLSRDGQLYLSLAEMQTIRTYYVEQNRDPSDIELETIAQTWSEHCSHKTLAGRIHYREEQPDNNEEHDAPREQYFENMLKETIFAATNELRQKWGADDWCASVFEDNAGIVRFDEQQNVCFKVETHNHPSALEPYGGANTGIGGVIRDPLGTGLGAKPICNTDVFCFAPPDVAYDELPPGVLHPKAVATGVVAGVRDYGNRMGIPTVNGAIYFDKRYIGNPLVYCGNVGMIPVDKCEKRLSPGDLIVAVGGRTGRDGIHGATFSSTELTQQSEMLSGGAVQIGNAITEKMVVDVILTARDRELYSAITDCGAGGFSSAVGEMGEKVGAEVWLDKVPLKYEGLSYTEIWISEAQERMVVAVPPRNWQEFHALCTDEGVEATVIGEFRETGRLILKYQDHEVGDLSMAFLHGGRPPVVRDAVYELHPSAQLSARNAPPKKRSEQGQGANSRRFNDDLLRILSSLNVCSKEWVIRQYDHEVQAGSVIKPLVGVANDGPSDAAVVRPDLNSPRGLVIACGMNPRFGEFDTYWMAASAIDEAVRNCVAVGADPSRIAILDNFCWGNTERPETLGSLVRAALACHDVALAFGTPFISGKDSLNNEFSYVDDQGQNRTVVIPPSLLISALGQMNDVSRAVSMDLKAAGNLLYLVGATRDELGGSHYALVNCFQGGEVPRVDLDLAPRVFSVVHQAIDEGLVRSCHDLSEGGLAVAAAEMAFAGGLGLELSLGELAEQSGIDDETVLLFSESNTRFLLEVPPAHQDRLSHLFADAPLLPMGHITEEQRLVVQGNNATNVIDVPLAELKTAWQLPLDWD